MKKILLPVLSCILVWSASAGFTMELSTKSEILSDQYSRINFTLLNSGDEAAYNVILEPLLPEGFNSDILYMRVLPSNMPFNGSFVINISPNAPVGKFPTPLMLHYTDLNSYPFSVLFPESVNHVNGSSSNVFMSLPMVDITGTAPTGFNLRVFNQDSKIHNVSIRLFIPKELGSDLTLMVVEIQPKSSVTLEKSIWSSSALYDSDYLLLGSASYSEDGVMHSSLSYGRAQIVRPAYLSLEDDIFKNSQWFVLLLILLSIVFIVYFSIKRRMVVGNEQEEKPKKIGRQHKIKGKIRPH